MIGYLGLEGEVMKLEENKVTYTMKEAENLTGFSEHAIRKYLKDFNIQVEKTEGGHRRFSPESIDKLKIVDEKKKLGWSVKQIGQFFNGEITSEMLNSDKELKTNIEKRLDSQEEKMDMLIQMNGVLMKKLDEQNELHRRQLKEQEQQILDRIEERWLDPIERRTMEMSNLLAAGLEERKQQKESESKSESKSEKKKGFWSRIIGG